MRNLSVLAKDCYMYIFSVLRLLIISLLALSPVIKLVHASDMPIEQGVKSNNPYLLVKDLATNTFEKLRVDREQIENDPKHLIMIVEEELMPYIDHELASFIVLGKYFKSVPNSKLSDYVSAFRTHLLHSFSNAMAYYTDQTVIFEPPPDFEGKSALTVKALISAKGEPDIDVAFKVRKSNKDDTWKAYDLVAQGVSLINTKRSEFQPILRQEGIDKVIELMQKHN